MRFRGTIGDILRKGPCAYPQFRSVHRGLDLDPMRVRSGSVPAGQRLSMLGTITEKYGARRITTRLGVSRGAIRAFHGELVRGFYTGGTVSVMIGTVSGK